MPVARREIDIGQPLVNPAVTHAHAQPDRRRRACRIERGECAQNPAPWQRQWDRQPARNRHDERRTWLAVNLESRNLETAGGALLGAINLSKEIDDRDGSVLDVTAAAA